MQAYKKVLSSISLFLVSVSLMICSASHVCLCVLDSEVRKPMPGLQYEGVHCRKSTAICRVQPFTTQEVQMGREFDVQHGVFCLAAVDLLMFNLLQHVY